MSFKGILKAAFNIGNIALLAFILIFSYLYFYLPFLLVGLAGYIYFVLQTLKNKDFQKEIYLEETIERIKKSSEDCSRLYAESRRRLRRPLDSRAKFIFADKEELMREFLKDRKNELKQKITEHALNLIKAYIKLTVNFSVRCGELVEADENKIRNRISDNNRKLGFVRDSNTAFDLNKAIEMDQKLLDSVKGESCELERILSKLDYMESAIRMLKRRMLTSDYDDGTFKEMKVL
jgi:predicted  nucleic acid-binding Zn-ribbon protein